MKKAGWAVVSGASVALGVGAWWLVRNSRWATESPGYRILRGEGDFEIREYPSMHLMGTPMREESDGFSRLLGYISGENEEHRRIEMTTPVLVSAVPNESEMYFVMPSAVSRDGDVPLPYAPDIHEETVRGGRFAAVRYAGRSDDDLEEEQVVRLSGWLWTMGLQPDGERFIAYYDPPWMPGPLRRNEILVRLM